MNNPLISLVFIIILTNCSDDNIPISETTLKNGLLYRTDKMIPLNGVVTAFYENGRKKYEKNYRDGLIHGRATSYYDDGSKRSEILFYDSKVNSYPNMYTRDGTLDRDMLVDSSWVEMIDGAIYDKVLEIPFTGKLVSYYSNGLKKSIENFDNGKASSPAQYWSETGDLLPTEKPENNKSVSSLSRPRCNKNEENWERDKMLQNTNWIASIAVSYWRKPSALGGGARSFQNVSFETLGIYSSDNESVYDISNISTNAFHLTTTGKQCGIIVKALITHQGVSGTLEIVMSSTKKNITSTNKSPKNPSRQTKDVPTQEIPQESKQTPDISFPSDISGEYQISFLNPNDDNALGYCCKLLWKNVQISQNGNSIKMVFKIKRDEEFGKKEDQIVFNGTYSRGKLKAESKYSYKFSSSWGTAGRFIETNTLNLKINGEFSEYGFMNGIYGKYINEHKPAMYNEIYDKHKLSKEEIDIWGLAFSLHKVDQW